MDFGTNSTLRFALLLTAIICLVHGCSQGMGGNLKGTPLVIHVWLPAIGAAILFAAFWLTRQKK